MARMAIKYRPIEDVYVNHEYQRLLNTRRIDRMESEFDETLVQPIKGFEMDDGRFEAFDGQHTRGLLERMGWKQVPTIAYNGILSEVEARALQFVRFNTMQKKPTPLEIFKAELRAGESRATVLDQISRRHGYVIGSNLMAVAALQDIYRRSDVQGVEDVLSFTRKTWDEADSSVHSGLLRALNYVLTNDDRPLEWDALSKKLSRYRPVDIVREGGGRGGGNSAVQGIAHEIYRLYNLRRRKRI
jgi:hypothetical protein